MFLSLLLFRLYQRKFILSVLIYNCSQNNIYRPQKAECGCCYLCLSICSLSLSLSLPPPHYLSLSLTHTHKSNCHVIFCPRSYTAVHSSHGGEHCRCSHSCQICWHRPVQWWCGAYENSAGICMIWSSHSIAVEGYSLLVRHTILVDFCYWHFEWACCLCLQGSLGSLTVWTATLVGLPCMWRQQASPNCW